MNYLSVSDLAEAARTIETWPPEYRQLAERLLGEIHRLAVEVDGESMLVETYHRLAGLPAPADLVTDPEGETPPASPAARRRRGRR